ncbi:DUF262 domain-containing protein [Acinetobacter nematophilus]|uniref:DUF262 domain-containing protein n=1 Tax=Acinetobacter nematophilus TaxID=2994642 RepID=A0A9X3IHB4_9GAMM|nr:DUF262 domain-containing protein [Acinetobacter nematophilus]MCX5468758.1 DUF262 domain-containing protein [Acinetobacter nematophilus]
MKADINKVEEEIYTKRKTVRYDIRDLTVEQIINKYQDSLDEFWDSETNLEGRKPQSYNLIYIPEYQRDFTWDENRQSKLIESIVLGLPIPFIFVAENSNSSWEVVDGSQRIRTLYNFVKNNLSLKNLESLKLLNNYQFNDLETSRKGKFLSTALRLIVLSEETTDDVKKDMFERINKGSDLLKPMESRKGIYKGKFNDFLYSYAKNDKYVELTPLERWLEKRQEREELLLRFFALSENKKFSIGLEKIGVSKHLDEYLDKKNNSFEKMNAKDLENELTKYKNMISNVIDLVDNVFIYGFRLGHNPHTKRSVFEAISIGVGQFIETHSQIDYKKFDKDEIFKGLNSYEFKKLINGNQLHKRNKLNGRVLFIVRLLEENYK